MCELSIIMPCLDEAKTLGTCIEKAKRFLAEHKVEGEIIIADNGSTDGSQMIAFEHGARVVEVQTRGYGAAIAGGINAAKGKYVIMGDADDSYNFLELQGFLIHLREGYDLVMGNRFRGGIASGAMPFLHRYVGNPVLTGIGKLFFRSQCGDFHCGLRGFAKESIMRLDLCTTGMEFASEMLVKATINRMRITEIPTTLSKDGRDRAPHLRSWRDGWRHLRFLLMFSPRWLFLYPGIALIAVGLAVMVLLVPKAVEVGNVTLDVHTLLLGGASIILGIQTLSFAFLAKQYGVKERILPADPAFLKLERMLSLEALVILGAVLVLVGVGGIGAAVYIWTSGHFGPLDYRSIMRIVIPSVTGIAVGYQMVIAGFLSSIIRLNTKGQG